MKQGYVDIRGPVLRAVIPSKSWAWNSPSLESNSVCDNPYFVTGSHYPLQVRKGGRVLADKNNSKSGCNTLRVSMSIRCFSSFWIWTSNPSSIDYFSSHFLAPFHTGSSARIRDINFSTAVTAIDSSGRSNRALTLVVEFLNWLIERNQDCRLDCQFIEFVAKYRIQYFWCRCNDN